MDYKSKYIKYKLKYLNFKQNGGNNKIFVNPTLPNKEIVTSTNNEFDTTDNNNNTIQNNNIQDNELLNPTLPTKPNK